MIIKLFFNHLLSEELVHTFVIIYPLRHVLDAHLKKTFSRLKHERQWSHFNLIDRKTINLDRSDQTSLLT